MGPSMMAMAAAVSAAAVSAAAGAGAPAYTLVGSFELPAAVSAIDTLPDGRLVTMIGDEVWRQDAVNGGAWSRIGSLPTGSVSGFGASFVRVSPDGSMLAVGDNEFGPGASVFTLAMASLDPGAPSAADTWSVANGDAHWGDAGTLFVSGGSEIVEIDLGAMSVRTVVANVGLSAGGLATRGSRLFVGNGFDLGGGASQTGEVRAFDLAVLAGAAADFSSGTPVADALSAATLGFDLAGNLLIGGGDVFGGSGDFGYAAVVDAAAVEAALLGGAIAPDSAEQRLTPASAGDSYFTRFNAATGEVLVTVFDNASFTPGTTVYRYAVPSPGAWSVAVVLVVGVRRRRSASAARTDGRGARRW